MNKYTLQQTAHETGLSTDTLRYYERIGLLTDIERADNGHRRYSDDDLTWIRFLKQLRATGMPIAQMQTFAALRRVGDTTIPQRRAMLETHRAALLAQIDAITAFIGVIDVKLARHRLYEQTQQERPSHDDSNDSLA